MEQNTNFLEIHFKKHGFLWDSKKTLDIQMNKDEMEALYF